MVSRLNLTEEPFLACKGMRIVHGSEKIVLFYITLDGSGASSNEGIKILHFIFDFALTFKSMPPVLLSL